MPKSTPQEAFRIKVENTMLKGTANPELVRSYSRFICQACTSMELDAVKNGDTTREGIFNSVPPSKWFGEEADRYRNRILKIAEERKIEGSLDQRVAKVIEQEVKIKIDPNEPDGKFMIRKFTDLGLTPEWNLTPVAIKNPARPNDELRLDPMELLDLMKLTRMENMAAPLGKELAGSPTRVEVGKGANTFIDEVIEKAKAETRLQKPTLKSFWSEVKAGRVNVPVEGRPIADIYAEHKKALVERLEKARRKIIPDDEKIDFSQYKDNKAAPVAPPLNNPEDLRKAAAAANVRPLNLVGMPADKTSDPLSGITLALANASTGRAGPGSA